MINRILKMFGLVKVSRPYYLVTLVDISKIFDEEIAHCHKWTKVYQGLDNQKYQYGAWVLEHVKSKTLLQMFKKKGPQL